MIPDTVNAAAIRKHDHAARLATPRERRAVELSVDARAHSPRSTRSPTALIASGTAISQPCTAKVFKDACASREARSRVGDKSLVIPSSYPIR